MLKLILCDMCRSPLYVESLKARFCDDCKKIRKRENAPKYKVKMKVVEG